MSSTDGLPPTTAEPAPLINESPGSEDLCGLAEEFAQVDDDLLAALGSSGRVIDIEAVAWRAYIGRLRLAADNDSSDAGFDADLATRVLERAEVGLLGEVWSDEEKAAGVVLQTYLADRCDVLVEEGFLESGVRSN